MRAASKSARVAHAAPSGGMGCGNHAPNDGDGCVVGYAPRVTGDPRWSASRESAPPESGVRSGLVARAVREALEGFASEAVADDLLFAALEDASLPSLPTEGSALGSFVRGSLWARCEDTLGPDAADAVLDRLEPIVAAMDAADRRSAAALGSGPPQSMPVPRAIAVIEPRRVKSAPPAPVTQLSSARPIVQPAPPAQGEPVSTVHAVPSRESHSDASARRASHRCLVVLGEDPALKQALRRRYATHASLVFARSVDEALRLVHGAHPARAVLVLDARAGLTCDPHERLQLGAVPRLVWGAPDVALSPRLTATTCAAEATAEDVAMLLAIAFFAG